MAVVVNAQVLSKRGCAKREAKWDKERKERRKEDRKRLSLLLFLLLFLPASNDDDSDDVQERAKGRVSETQSSSSSLGQLRDISRSSLLLQYSNFFYFSAN